MKKNCLLKYISIIVGTIIFLIVPIVLFITNQDDKIKSTYILYFIVIASIFIHIIIYCVANNSFKHIDIKFSKEKKEKEKKKSLKIYGILFISYFTALFLTGKLKLYNEYLENRSSNTSGTGSTDKTVMFDYLGLVITIFTIFTIFAIIVLSLDQKNKLIFITCTIFIFSVLAIPTFFSNKDYILSIFFILSYSFSLIINYYIINKLPDLYRSLHTNGKLDFAKLTLLWTIIVFLLGVFFNIKP